MADMGTTYQALELIPWIRQMFVDPLGAVSVGPY
jgi:hypothetical protein